jgi:hypothetical protein
MRPLRCFLLCISLLGPVLLHAQQRPEDAVVAAAQHWMQDISSGDKASLNKTTDPSFIATTPAGEVVAKSRLIPDDDRPVQRLPLFTLKAPLVRISNDTAVLMTRLAGQGSADQMNATFVFISRDAQWKLLALHLSPAK